MQPFTPPANPFDRSSRAPEVREAIRLHEAATRANDALGAAYEVAREARDAVTNAQRALDDAIRKSAETGRPHKDELRFAQAIKAAEDAADPQIHGRRIGLAVEAQRATVARYHAYCREHLPALLDTFRQEAEEAAEAVAEAYAQIAPVRARRGEIASRVAALINVARSTLTQHGATLSLDEAEHWAIAQEETEAALPRAAVLAHYYPEAAVEHELNPAPAEVEEVVVHGA